MAKALVKPSTAPFVAQYTLRSGRAALEALDEMFTIEPGEFLEIKFSITAWLTLNTALAFTLKDLNSYVYSKKLYILFVYVLIV